MPSSVREGSVCVGRWSTKKKEDAVVTICSHYGWRCVRRATKVSEQRNKQQKIKLAHLSSSKESSANGLVYMMNLGKLVVG
jgi:hypothetical protein